MGGLIELAKRKEWPGYFGVPRDASVSCGKKVWKAYSARVVEPASQILDRQDPRQFPRYADEQWKTIPPAAWQATLDSVLAVGCPWRRVLTCDSEESISGHESVLRAAVAGQACENSR
jgi:hypothetical protein